jgi:hypothetical protein
MRKVIKKKPGIGYLLVAVAVIIYIYHSTLFFDWVVDDAGISFGFAKNIANGYGAVLNPGGEVVEGYSNPLWVLIISLFIRADIFDPYLTTNFLGILLGVTNLIATYLLTKELVSNKESLLTGLPSVFLAFSTPFVAWSLSGLETPLYSLLLVLSVYTYVLELKGKSKYPISGLLLFLVAVTRPEGFGFFGLILGHKTVYSYRNGFNKNDIMWLLLFIVPFGVYHVWHYSYFGFILPNTYYYKAGGSLFSSLRSGYDYILPFFIEYRMWLLILFIPSIFINSLKSNRPVLHDQFYARSAVLLMVFGGIIFALATGGDWMMELRFIAPIVPFALILVYTGTREMASAISRFNKWSNIQFGLLAVMIILVSGLVIQPSLSSSPEASADPTVPLDNVNNNEEYASSIAEKSDTLDNATLLVPDLGAHAYYGDLRYIDLAGLADVTIGHHKYEDSIFGDYIFQQKEPTIIKTHGTWTRRSNIKSYDEFQKNYTSVKASDNWFVRKSTFTSTTTEPQTNTNISVNNISFSGYTNHKNITHPGGNIHYTGFWNKTGKTNQSYRVKVQIIKQDNVVDQHSRSIVYGWYPASQWEFNETYFEHYKYTIPNSLDEGSYNVSIIIESSSFSKQIVDDEILVSSNQSTALAEEKYGTIAEDNSAKQNLRLAEQAHELNPNNKTYQLELKKYEREYYYKHIQLAKKTYQKGEIDTSRKYIDKVGHNLLNNRTANNIRARVSNEYLKRGDHAKSQGNISKAHEMYKKSVAVYGKNSEAIAKRTKIRNNPKIRYSKFIYGNVPQNAASVRVRVRFSDKLDLVGYELQSKNIQSGAEISLRYYFECQQKMDRDYTLFSHHEGQNKNVNSRNRFQGDHMIKYPTSKCTPGDIIMTRSLVRTPSVDGQTSVAVKMGVWYPDSGEGLEPNVIAGNVSVNNGRVEIVEYNLTAQTQ